MELRHILPISGKDSCATALVQMEREPALPYELMFTDVGAELPETYAWLDKVEKRLGRKILRIGESLTEIIYDQNILPSPRRRFCTKYAKIYPMEKFVGKDEATTYIGIRADEDRGGLFSNKPNFYVRLPLREAGIGLSGVYRILEEKDLMPPAFFWERLHAEVVKRWENQAKGFGFRLSAEKIFAQWPRWLFSSVFAWRTRSNCFFCFFQRKYEWVGLLDVHPELFAEAEKIEREVGGLRESRPELKKEFHWRPDFSLPEIRRNAAKIFDRRVRAILRMMRTRRRVLLGDEGLSQGSCGLFCGK